MNELTTQSGTADGAAPSRGSRPIMIAAGLGGIMAFVFWLLQPFLVFAITAGAEDLFGTREYYLTFPFNGLYEAVVFSGVGVGVLAAVIGTTELARRRAPEASVFLRVGQVMGIAAGTAWFVVAGLGLAAFTSVGLYVDELVPGAVEQAAVYEALSLVLTGVLLVFPLGMIGWLVSFGIGARRRGVIGWPMAILAFVTAAVSASPMFMPFSPPWGSIGGLLYLLVLGIVLLIRSRKA